jgi:hypothetical protein
MPARIIGQPLNMGPLNIAANTIVAHGDLVTLAAGLAIPVADATVADIAIAMDGMPDPDFGGVKTQIDVARVGEDVEIEMPFQGAAIAQASIGVTYNLLALNGGTVNLAAVNAPAFTVLRLGRNTAMGAVTGFVIGVIIDTAAL